MRQNDETTFTTVGKKITEFQHNIQLYVNVCKYDRRGDYGKT